MPAGVPPVPRPCVRRVPLRHAMLASPPSLHPHYQASAVLRGDPTSSAPSAFLASSARTGILPRRRRPWISLVPVTSHCQARTGLRPREPPRHSPLARRGVWPSALNIASAHSNSDNLSGLNTFTAWLPASAIGPRFLSVYASTRPLPVALQDSIQGPWLAATLAGSLPACRDDLARSLVQRVVGPLACPLR